MKDIIVTMIACVGFVLFVTFLGFGTTALNLSFMPWVMEKETEIYENSRSHIAGVNDTITRTWMDYNAIPDGPQRVVLLSLICSEAMSIEVHQLSGPNQDVVSELCGRY